MSYEFIGPTPENDGTPSPLVECPKCRSEWWKAVVSIDMRCDVPGLSNLIECNECGYLGSTMHLTNTVPPGWGEES